MKLAATVDDITSIPEDLRENYSERDGKHYLQIEGWDSAVELKEALRKEREDHSATREAGKTVNALIEKHGGVESIETHLAEHSTLQATAAESTRLRKDNVFFAAVTEVHGNHTMLKDHVDAHTVIKVNGEGQGFVAVVDGSGEVRNDNEGKPLTVLSYLNELKTMPEWGGAFKGTGSSGSGAPADGASSDLDAGGNGRPTAFSKTRKNMTAREKIDCRRWFETQGLNTVQAEEAYLNLP